MEPLKTPDVQRILLATDFSRWSMNAVEYAFEVARGFDAEVLMVHGIEPISDQAIEEDEDGGDFDEFFGELTAKARDRLEELVERAEKREVKARFHIEIGERWRIILDHAESEDVDLIVVGRRARIEHGNLSLGTTSQRVYFGTDRPVMTVPSDPEESEEGVEVLDEGGSEE